jgi:erythromycin esterase-like protein
VQRAGEGENLYSLSESISAVLNHLDKHDPDAARLARVRYGCLTSWQDDLAIYGHAAHTAGFGKCEAAVVAQLQELLQKRLNNEDDDDDDHRLFGAAHNARLIASAERCYRG